MSTVKSWSTRAGTGVATLAVAAVVAGAVFLASLTMGGGGDNTSTTVSAVPTVSTAAVAGVAVDVPSVDLGPVPLDKYVDQTFTIRNGGAGKAQLGKPRVETLEGC